MRLWPRTERNETPPPWIVEPFLHVDRDRIHNPLTDRTLSRGEELFSTVQRLAAGGSTGGLDGARLGRLAESGWVIENRGDPARRHRLRFVEIEAGSSCNQACYFCPVSTDPREAHSMPMALYEQIIRQLVPYRDTLEAVMMLHYNEPTADPAFLDHVRVLRSCELPIGLNTNGTGLTKKRVDVLEESGGLRFLSVNLSTLDRERYRRDRGRDHLPQVLRNLEDVRDRPVADIMEIAVLGRGDDVHERDFEAIRRHFSDSRFEVKYYEMMDRAGHLEEGLKPRRPHRRLKGCEQTGSRPLQWLHVTATGDCVLCCEDYSEQYVVGNLTRETVAEVLSGPRISRLRRWVYGLDEAPDDFICRRCLFARAR